MLFKQIQGVVKLSLPVIVLCSFFPSLPVNLIGKFLCALIVGLYVFFLNWQQMKNLRMTLHYSPTNTYKDHFQNLIKECNIEPDSVVLRYAYTNESIALTSGNMIIIDPVVCNSFDDDPEAKNVQHIFKNYVQGALSQEQQNRIAAIPAILTPGAQRFIFKHELGHVVKDFSNKGLLNAFIMAFVATYIGIVVAMELPFAGPMAGLGGMIIGGISDLLLSFSSNFLWRNREEQKADEFAAHHSSYEDIVEAAHFFERHQEIIDIHLESENILSYIPSRIRTGHPHGKIRAAYLLALAQQKNINSKDVNNN
jgi:hypothetical protein